MGHQPPPDGDDRLIRGTGPDDDPGERALASFVADLRSTFSAAPDAATRASHLAAMAAIEPEAMKRPVAGRLRRRGLRSLVAVSALTFLGASAMAATGTLPDPIQDVAADSAELVGLDLPGGENQGTPKNPRAAANKARAEAFTDAKKAWVACVREAEAAHEGEEPLDREAACGEKPHPHDFVVPAKSENAVEKTPKPERTEKPDKPDNVQKPESVGPEKTPKPDNPHKPAVVGQPDKTPRPVRTPKGPPA